MVKLKSILIAKIKKYWFEMMKWPQFCFLILLQI